VEDATLLLRLNLLL